MQTNGHPRGYVLIRAFLFVALSICVPIVYYLFVAGGIISLAALTTVTLVHLKESFSLLGAVNIVHLLIYGAILSIASRRLATYIWLAPGGGKAKRFACILLLLVVLGFMPIFGFFGHGTYAPQNAYQVWFDAFKGINF